MGLFSEEFKEEEKEFLKQIGESISLEDIAKIRKKYDPNFNLDRRSFDDFKKEVLKRKKPEA